MRVLIFGAGFSGRAIGRRLSADGHPVVGTTRSPERLERLRLAAMEPLVFDGVQGTPELRAELARTTHLILSAAPSAEGDPVLNALEGDLGVGTPALRWIGYLSTVGVYGDRGGNWVAEDDRLDPTSTRGRQRVAAEEAWLRFGAGRGVPVALLRLAGIYGPGRNALVNLAEGTAKRVIKPNQVFNRIHVDDIAGATALLAQKELGGAFNITDNEPAPPQDVVAFAASLLGVEAPPEVPFEAAEMSPMARSFYGDNKRVSNARLRETGYEFRYPDYRTALSDMVARKQWRDEQ